MRVWKSCEGEAEQWQCRRGFYSAIDGREVGRDRVGAVGAGDAAKPATQEALDWGTCLDVGAVTRVLSYRKNVGPFWTTKHMRPPLTSM